MEYILEGAGRQRNISVHEYEALVLSKNRLAEAYYIEEKFDLVLGNYSELENNLLSSAVEHMVYGPQGEKWYRTQKNHIIRRVLNLLASCRLYIDQTQHHLSRIYGSGTEIPKAFKLLVHSEYDSCAGYRIMDELRNYSQHRGYPFQAMSFPIKMVDPNNSKNMLFSITPLIEPKIMAKDRRVKKKVLSELMAMGDRMDIKPIYREYIESLWRIHAELRVMTSNDLFGWEQLVLRYFNDLYGSIDTQKMPGLGIIVKEDDRSIVEAEYLSRDVIYERKYYERRNRNLNNISRRYVTGEIINPVV